MKKVKVFEMISYPDVDFKVWDYGAVVVVRKGAGEERNIIHISRFELEMFIFVLQLAKTKRDAWRKLTMKDLIKK